MEKGYFQDSVIKNGTHACNYLLTCDMEMNPQDGFEYSNWKGGYGDFHLQPDMNTLRVATWQDRSAIVLCDLLDPKTHEIVPFPPRSILR